MPRGLLLRRALWAGVVLGLAGYLALTLWLAISGIFFPYQLDYGEGIVLWFTRELALGHPIYKALEGLPYASSNYPPLGLLIAVPFRSIFGDTYIGGRLLNLAALLVVCATLYRIVRSETRGSFFAAAFAALFFAGSTFIYHWSPLFRVDLYGLAFTTAGVYCVWRWEREVIGNQSRARRTTSYLLLALLLFLCALFIKHSFLFAPAAAIAAIFLKDRRAAGAFAFAFVAIAGAIFLALDAWTGGGFSFGLVASNATVWSWETFLPLLRDFLWTYLILIALATWAWAARVRQGRVGVLEVYAVAAVASLALAGRVGAWENYFFEAVFIVCTFAGLTIGALFVRRTAATAWFPLLLILQLALFWPDHDPAIARSLMQITRLGNEAVGPLVRAAPGTVISEDMGLLVTNGRPVDYYTFQYSNLARAGNWDQHWEVNNLRSGKFPLVILSRGTREDVDTLKNFTREFVSALDYGYALEQEDERYHVYTPSPLQHLRSADFDGRIQLVGWSLTPSGELHAGTTVTLTLVWQAGAKPRERYTAFAHLEDSNGVIAQDDHEPKVGLKPGIETYPTTRWAPDENMRDTFVLKVPSGLPPVTYSLRVGWYNSVSEDRLPVQGGGDYVELAQLVIN